MYVNIIFIICLSFKILVLFLNRLFVRFFNVFFRFFFKYRDVLIVCFFCFVVFFDLFLKNVIFEVFFKWLKSYDDKYYVVILYMVKWFVI